MYWEFLNKSWKLEAGQTQLFKRKIYPVSTAKGCWGRKAGVVKKGEDEGLMAKITELCKNDWMWFVFLLKVFISYLAYGHGSSVFKMCEILDLKWKCGIFFGFYFII